ncbi:methyltransferase [Guyanagaster necrorhizus]|uniref:tRNA N(3)-methylcytidine methyltransferase n=1 Tax=Guyanagaster necrorhizus TaxID=856835 RepID=A0A9P8ARI0_9AGAR|nr:methyltransferase [Guyanagaster necrorhizus MCA 3950]KAG7445115.1 methyltransferase [Guyanagaster necrorhizus MCA 3950]
MEDQANLNDGRSNLKCTSSVHDVAEEKPPFGSRFLTDDAEVWTQNAWDHVPPPDDQDEIIAASLTKQRSAPVPEDDKRKYHDKPAKFWDNFYKANSSNFFRDRKWLHNEFPELVEATLAKAGTKTIVEIGCGAGNSVFPLLASNQNPDLSIFAFDYAHHAVKLVQSNPLYESPPMGSITAAPWDLSSDKLPKVEPGSVDIVIMVFVLSALHPDEWHNALKNMHTMLKPGGLVMFRDYGRHDLTQLRFKGGRLLDDNFYIRGDKTRVYFFELDELSLLFTGSRIPESEHSVKNTVEDDNGLSVETDVDAPSGTETPATADVPEDIKAPSIHPSLLSSHPLPPLFATEQLGVDRRLIVNRKRQIKMYRVWMQGKFRRL